MPFTSHAGLNLGKYPLHAKFLQNVVVRKRVEEDASAGNRVLNARNFVHALDSANIII